MKNGHRGGKGQGDWSEGGIQQVQDVREAEDDARTDKTFASLL